MSQIILATTSPYRKRLFNSLGIEYISESSFIDENFKGRPETPGVLVKILAKLKAESVTQRHSSGIVIGFDSVAERYGGSGLSSYSETLEKPKNREEAFERLKKLSGNIHYFFTGIHMINIDSKKVLTDIVKTKIFMREIADDEINLYLDSDPNFNTYSLGYSPPEHYSATFVDRIEGSIHNLLWGLPVERIMPMLFKIGYRLPERKFINQ
jgi:septum formation protein